MTIQKELERVLLSEVRRQIPDSYMAHRDEKGTDKTRPKQILEM